MHRYQLISNNCGMSQLSPVIIVLSICSYIVEAGMFQAITVLFLALTAKFAFQGYDDYSWNHSSTQNIDYS